MVFRFIGLAVTILLSTTTTHSFAAGGCKPNLSEDLASKIVSAEGGCKEKKSGVIWSLRGPTVDYSSAVKYCESNGWKLATLDDVWRAIDLDIVSGFNIGRVHDDRFWTRGIAGTIDDREFAHVASLIDKDDFELKAVEVEAAVVCVGQGTTSEEACSFDEEDADFVTTDGGCRLRGTDLVFSPVFGPTDIESARRNCARAKFGGREGAWSLAGEEALKQIVGMQSAIDQIQGLTRASSLWVAEEAEGKSTIGSGSDPNGRSFYLFEQKFYVWTMNMSNGLPDREHISMHRQYPCDSFGNQMSYRRWDGGYLSFIGDKRVTNLSRTTSGHYICTSQARE